MPNLGQFTKGIGRHNRRGGAPGHAHRRGSPALPPHVSISPVKLIANQETPLGHLFWLAQVCSQKPPEHPVLAGPNAEVAALGWW